MRPELFSTFIEACKSAQKITELPDLGQEKYNQLFMHMSNVDMETTIRTINYAHRMLLHEVKKTEKQN